MKKYINSIKTGTLLFVVSLFAMPITSCSEAEMQVFESKHGIYFPISEKDKRGIDSAYVSFFQNPGKDRIIVPFKIMLIGDLLTEDTEYKLEVIDSLTTALPEEYALPEKMLFRKGRNADTLYVTVFNKDRLSDTDVRVAFNVVENENFRAGYYNMQKIKIRFDNIIGKPLWWDKSIELIYLGTFSVEKYQLFIRASGGEITAEGLEAWELRKICLYMKKLIEKEGITEEDGSPMEIVSY